MVYDCVAEGVQSLLSGISQESVGGPRELGRVRTC